jgi:hypothetical protein
MYFLCPKYSPQRPVLKYMHHTLEHLKVRNAQQICQQKNRRGKYVLEV